MADFSTDWAPDFMMTYAPEYKTLVSKLGEAKEQRRKVWTNRRRMFTLSYSARKYDTIDAIRAFFEARSGSYESFTFPVFGLYIKGTRLACVDGGGSSDTITDTLSEFVKRGFINGKKVAVAGSGLSNDGFYTLTGVAAGTLTMATATLAGNESTNASLIVYPAFTARFDSDSWDQVFTAPNINGLNMIQLVEVL